MGHSLVIFFFKLSNYDIGILNIGAAQALIGSIVKNMVVTFFLLR